MVSPVYTHSLIYFFYLPLRRLSCAIFPCPMSVKLQANLGQTIVTVTLETDPKLETHSVAVGSIDPVHIPHEAHHLYIG